MLIRFRKEDGTEYPQWIKVSFEALFEEYNKKNTNNYKQYTVGKLGLIKKENQGYQYKIDKHKEFESKSLIIGIGVEEVGIATDEIGCVSPIYNTFKINTNEADILFLKYYLAQYLYRIKNRISRKSTRRENEIEIKNLKECSIRIPSIEEQQKIADFLATVDQKIEAQKTIVTDYQELKKGTMQKIFNQEIRFKDDDGNEFPEWKNTILEKIFKFQYGQFNNNPDNGGEYPIYGANGVIGGYNKFNAENSIIIGHMGAHAGSVLYEAEKHFVTYNGTITTPLNSNEIDTKYGYYLLIHLDLNKICTGSGQPFLSYAMLNKINCLIPCYKEQKKIADCLSALDRKIEAEKKILADLEELKKGLLQAIFNN